MKFLSNYNKNIVKYDLLNKFNYDSINNIPKLKIIHIHLSLKKPDLKLLLSYLAMLKIVTKQNSFIVTAKKSNIIFKIRKGIPIGCKVTLRKTKMFLFYWKLLNQEFFSINSFKLQKNSVSFQLKKLFSFNEIELNYQFFSNLKFLNVNLITTSSNYKQNKFILSSYKIN